MLYQLYVRSWRDCDDDGYGDLRGIIEHLDHLSWLGTDGAALAARTLGRPALLLNDADAAGIAEMRWGAGRGLKGVVIMLTFGTGIGTALFADGKLFPNTELGHLELNGIDAEEWASARVRTQLGLDWPAWIERVNAYLKRMHALFWPDAFILGGAVAQAHGRHADAGRMGPGRPQLRDLGDVVPDWRRPLHGVHLHGGAGARLPR